MEEIKYYPLIECDTDGKAFVGLFPTNDERVVKAKSKMWLSAMIPHYYRLYANVLPKNAFSIHCPCCGKELKCISSPIDEYKRELYECKH